MSANKYPRLFLQQMEAIVYIWLCKFKVTITTNLKRCNISEKITVSGRFTLASKFILYFLCDIIS